MKTGEFSNSKDSVVEDKEEGGLMFTAHEVLDEPVPDSSDKQLTPLSSPHGGDKEEPVFQSIHEDQVFEANHIDQISEDVDNDEISEDVDNGKVSEDTKEDQVPQDIHVEQNLPVSTPFAAVAMNSPSTDESIDTPETIEEDLTPESSIDQVCLAQPSNICLINSHPFAEC